MALTFVPFRTARRELHANELFFDTSANNGDARAAFFSAGYLAEGARRMV
jgi:hypothetical protein